MNWKTSKASKMVDFQYALVLPKQTFADPFCLN
jgi:hypothetical protein